MPSDNQSTAEIGRRLVADALRDRGANISEIRRGNLIILEARHPNSPERVHIRVKTRRSGTWQASTRDADPDPRATRPAMFWVFIDLERSSRYPEFYIVPDAWMRRDIHEAHQAYLDRHGGKRAITQGSDHHALQKTRIRSWKNRWDLLGDVISS